MSYITNVLVHSIINIGNSQNFYLSYCIRHSPWRADEWIFPALMAILLRKLDSTKYLGITLQSNLTWDKHINNITSKANQTLDFLHRNLKVNSQKIKDHAYKALVRPKLEYSSCVWDPPTTNQINQLEKVQRHAARFVCGPFHNTPSVCTEIYAGRFRLALTPSSQTKNKIDYVLQDNPLLYSYIPF